jgi:WD40 repeat protein
VDTIPAANGTVRFLSFPADGDILIAGGWWRIDAWNLHEKSRQQLQSHGVGGADISTDGRFLTAYFDGCLRVSEIGGSAGLLRLGGGSVRGRASVSPDGQLIASGTESRAVTLWETATGLPDATLPPHAARVSSCHFSPSGTLLATCYEDGTVKLWDLTTGTMVNSFDGSQTATRYSLSFAPDGRTMASTRLDGTIQIREVSTCKVVETIPAAETEILSVRFSPDGRTLAATYRQGNLRLFSAEGDLTVALDTVGPAWTVAFGPDSNKLAIACWWTMPIQIWNLTTLTRELLLTEPKAAVWEVAYMPSDPSILASASSDGTVQFWDLTEGRNILTLDPFEHFDATSVSFTPDGKTLVATGGDGSLCVWDLEYFERHMAGNFKRQMHLLHPELGDAIQTDRLNAWAEDVAHRPWPRLGPRAAPDTSVSCFETTGVGVGPRVIESWGRISGPDTVP